MWIALNYPNNRRKWPELHGRTNILHKVLLKKSNHSGFIIFSDLKARNHKFVICICKYKQFESNWVMLSVSKYGKFSSYTDDPPRNWFDDHQACKGIGDYDTTFGLAGHWEGWKITLPNYRHYKAPRRWQCRTKGFVPQFFYAKIPYSQARSQKNRSEGGKERM